MLVSVEEELKKRPPRMHWAFRQVIFPLINLAGFAQRHLGDRYFS